ncbi:MAG: hypothetical protein ACTHK7_15660 [Aureliella sp.]
MNIPLHHCKTKAVIADGDQLAAGPNWVLSRRATLSLYDDHLQCADWRVGYGDIREAVLASFKTPILRIPGHVLSIQTDTNTFHFGLGASKYWETDVPFPVVRVKSRLRLSPISVLARLAVVAGVVYLIWLLVMA